MAKSFRLKFQDIDAPSTVSMTDAPVKGYITVRAPKGTTKAMYFPYGNELAINSMIGLPTANWIDLYEAVAFNQEYGLYISAPPGTSAEYPSYYGGVYLTTRGPYDYWQVSDTEEPSFEVCMIPGEEKAKWGTESNTSEVSIKSLGTETTQGLIEIKGISADIFARMNYINLNYWGAEGSLPAGIVSYYLDGNKLYYVNPDDGIIKDCYCGIYELVDGKYNIYIGGDSNTEIMGVTKAVSSNSLNIKTPWISFNSLINLKGLKNTTNTTQTISVTNAIYKLTTRDKLNYGTSTCESFLNQVLNTTAAGAEITVESGETLVGNVVNDIIKYHINISINNNEYYPISIENEYFTTKTSIEEKLKTLLLTGVSADNTITVYGNTTTNVKLNSFAGLDTGSRFNYRVNIKSITFARIHQKSCYETPTYIEISDIGYDQWRYDQACSLIELSNIKGTIDDVAAVALQTNLTDIVLSSSLVNAIIMGNSDGLVIVKSGEDLGVFKLDTVSGKLADVTSDYRTQRFYIINVIDENFISKADATDEYSYTIREVVNASSLGLGSHKIVLCEDSTTSAYPLKKDPRFNTLTVSCKEIVFPGEYKSGGIYTGSLSETGTDSYGQNIFWPNILPENEITFMEVVPVATLEQLNSINDQGFYTGSKIVDPIGPAKDIYSNYIKGQRYCTHVNEENQKNGMLGSTWADGYYQIIKDGIIEAQSPEYDSALVFMEPSGYEDYKSLLMSLRVKYHDTSTIISPKIITKAELSNPSTITVSGRTKGSAQYIGEFKKYDTYTGKYYYCQPIGDVGLQLARIMDKKMGGVAPAGTNDSNGLGGCLARSVLSAKYQFSEEALQILDEKGLCAITYDADNGLMIQSQKSTQDPSSLNDWSYLGHSMSFDLCKREIRDNVMTQQVFKRINPSRMEICTKKVKNILDKRTTGKDPIWALADVDIFGQNNGTTMAKREFVMKVTCKVYVYSETVLLMWENLPQE